MECNMMAILLIKQQENPEAELAEGDWKLVDLPKVE